MLQPEDFAKHSLAQIMTRINTELETLIMKHPDQYFWLHDRDRGAPELIARIASVDLNYRATSRR